MEWDQNELVPESVFKTFAEHNMLVPSLPAPLPVDWLKKLGIHTLLGGVKVEEFDYLHMMIYTDEVRVLNSLNRRLMRVDESIRFSWTARIIDNWCFVWNSSLV
jgi:hypothetical protein